MHENVNTIPEFIRKDDGVSYSNWVIGTYYENQMCPFRVVRAYKDSFKIGWEEPSGQKENEDLFDIPAPDAWYTFKTDIEKET
jgi:hypothetical protein